MLNISQPIKNTNESRSQNVKFRIRKNKANSSLHFWPAIHFVSYSFTESPYSLHYNAHLLYNKSLWVYHSLHLHCSLWTPLQLPPFLSSSSHPSFSSSLSLNLPRSASVTFPKFSKSRTANELFLLSKLPPLAVFCNASFLLTLPASSFELYLRYFDFLSNLFVIWWISLK